MVVGGQQILQRYQTCWSSANNDNTHDVAVVLTLWIGEEGEMMKSTVLIWAGKNLSLCSPLRGR